MNQKQSWEEEFDEKAEASFASGGFLVTDYPGENGVNHWCIDPLSIKDFIKQAIQTREREISEEVEKIDGQDRLYEGREFVDVDVVLSIVGGKKYEDLC